MAWLASIILKNDDGLGDSWGVDKDISYSDAVYDHGMLNVSVAFDPVGPLKVNY